MKYVDRYLVKLYVCMEWRNMSDGAAALFGGWLQLPNISMYAITVQTQMDYNIGTFRCTFHNKTKILITAETITIFVDPGQDFTQIIF